MIPPLVPASRDVEFALVFDDMAGPFHHAVNSGHLEITDPHGQGSSVAVSMASMSDNIDVLVFDKPASTIPTHVLLVVDHGRSIAIAFHMVRDGRRPLHIAVARASVGTALTLDALIAFQPWRSRTGVVTLTGTQSFGALRLPGGGNVTGDAKGRVLAVSSGIVVAYGHRAESGMAAVIDLDRSLHVTAESAGSPARAHVVAGRASVRLDPSAR